MSKETSRRLVNLLWKSCIEVPYVAGNGIRVGIGKSFLNPASQHGIANTMSFSGDNLPCLLYDLFSDQRHSALNIKIPDLYSLKSAYPY